MKISPATYFKQQTVKDILTVRTKRLATREITVVDALLGIIEGYIAIWGSPDDVDAYGTWFDQSKPPDMALDFLPFPLMYEHGFDPDVGKDIIGAVREIWFDDIGIAFRGELDRTSRHFDRVLSEVLDGVLATSSSTGDHIATFDAENRFVTWYLTEHSLTKSPAEFKMPIVKVVRSSLMIGDGARDALTSQKRTQRNKQPHIIKGKSTMPRKIMYKGKVVSKKRLRGLVNAGIRAVFDEQGNELTVEQALAMMLEDGAVSAQEVMAILQEMVAADAPSQDDGERNLDGDDNADNADTNPDDDIDDDDDDDTDELNDMTFTLPQLVEAFAQRMQTNAPAQRSTNNGNNNDMTALVTAMRQALESQAPDEDNMNTRQRPKKGNNSDSTRHTPNVPDIRVLDKFHDVSAGALALGIKIMDVSARHYNMPNLKPSDEMLKAFMFKAAVAMDEGKVSNVTEMAMRAIGVPDRKDIFGATGQYLRSIIYRANELTGTSDVDGWVDYFQSDDLWLKVREMANLFNALQSRGMRVGEIPQGFKGTLIPLEGIDFTFYKTSESTDWDAASGRVTPKVTPSKTDGSNLQIPVGKISALALMPTELREDSIIPMLEESRRKLQTQTDEKVEYYLLNGDTETSANSNINAGTTTPAASKDFLIFDGLLKEGLINNTPVDANNTMTDALYTSIYDQMDDEYMEEERLVYVQDKRTGLTARALADVKTKDVNSSATIENGVLSSIWGIDILTSSRMKPALATGLIDDTTAANNTQGRIVLVRPDQCAFVWKRRPSIEIVRDGISDSEALVMHMRLGFKVRDSKAVKGAIDVKTSKSA